MNQDLSKVETLMFLYRFLYRLNIEVDNDRWDDLIWYRDEIRYNLLR